MAANNRGVTLVEVLGALVILGMLVVGVITAKGRFVRQLTHAERKSQAVRLADELLKAWWIHPESFPRRSQGTLDRSFTWRTQVTDNPQLQALGAQVISLEMFNSGEASAPLVHVEVVLAAPASQQGAPHD